MRFAKGARGNLTSLLACSLDEMIVVMHGFIFSVHTLKEPQIVTGFVLIVLSRHAVIVLSRHAVIVLSRHAVNVLVSRLLYLSFFDIFTFFCL